MRVLRKLTTSLLAILLPLQALAAPSAPAGPGGPGLMTNVIFFAGFIVIFYLLIWRPQSKRAKEHKNLMGGLSKGDEVITSGGLVGRIVKVTDDFIVLEVADKVEVKVQKVSITAALPKGTIKDI